MTKFDAPPIRSYKRGAVRTLDCDSSMWNAVIKDLQGTDIYDIFEYHKISSRGQGHIARLVLFEEGDYRIAIPLVFRSIDSCLCGHNGWVDASSVYGFTGPLANCEEIPEEVRVSFQEALTGDLLQKGVVSVFSRLNPFRSNDRLISSLGEISEVGRVVVLDLTCNDQVRFRGYRRNHQDNIRRLRTLQAKTIHDSQFAHLEKFHSMYLEGMIRKDVKPYYLFDGEYFTAITKELANHAYLLINHLDGMTTCGALFLRYGDRVHAHLVATNVEFLRLAPLKQLLDDAACFFRGLGCQVMHIGGGIGGQDDSLLHFKSGFSKLHYPFKTWRWVVDQGHYERLVCARGAEFAARNAGHFPCYRCREDIV